MHCFMNRSLRLADQQQRSSSSRAEGRTPGAAWINVDCWYVVVASERFDRRKQFAARPQLVANAQAEFVTIPDWLPALYLFTLGEWRLWRVLFQ